MQESVAIDKYKTFAEMEAAAKDESSVNIKFRFKWLEIRHSEENGFAYFWNNLRVMRRQAEMIFLNRHRPAN